MSATNHTNEVSALALLLRIYATRGPNKGTSGHTKMTNAIQKYCFVIRRNYFSALTSYSPSVLALNDMLRQQLQLTSQFIDTQKRMHQAYVRNLEPDYMYTTLEDTKNVSERISSNYCVRNGLG